MGLEDFGLGQNHATFSGLVALKLLFLGVPAWCLGKGFKGLLGFRKMTSGKRCDESHCAASTAVNQMSCCVDPDQPYLTATR